MADAGKRRKIAILVSIPEGDEGIRSLRALLKLMLRGYGIRCLAVRPPSETVTFADRSPDTIRTKPEIAAEKHAATAKSAIDNATEVDSKSTEALEA